MSADPVGHPRNYLVRSSYVSAFQHMGEVYLYHDLYGYILKMSPDILEFLYEFADPVDPSEVCERYAEAFDEQAPEQFVGVFQQFMCLVGAQDDETDAIWEMVGVPAMWKVWERHNDGSMTFYTAWGESPLRTHRLDASETAIWDAFDGETSLESIADEHGREAVAALVKRLTHHNFQALKLSAGRMSFFTNRQHMKPPYLTSTMPYAAYDPATDPAPVPLEGTFSPESYYEREVDDAEGQFDHQETTLSHLFRKAHPALNGRNYGQTLIDALEERGQLPDSGSIRVLEIGAGLGFVAEAATRALAQRGLEVSYDILELSPTLAQAQRQRTQGLPVTVHEGNALRDSFPGKDYDLIIANEMIGDLPAVKLAHTDIGLDNEALSGDSLVTHIAKLGEVGEFINRYNLPLGDAPDPCYLNIGAMRLIERTWDLLRPGGVAIMTEFGNMARYPILSTQLDHPELSIHFGHLTLVARDIGFETDFVFVIDLLNMQRSAEGLATTRSYFSALVGMFESHGVTLEKIGYTRELYDKAVAASDLEPGSFGDIDFRRIEDRLMGLVPHEFKALFLERPADAPA